MKEQFVTYEIALALKELGFNEKCLCTYGKSDKRFMRNPGTNMIEEPIDDTPYYWTNSNIHKSVIAAPLWQQVIDWFREKYNISIEIRRNYPKNKYFYTIGSKSFQHVSESTFVYQKAIEFAILKAIEILSNDKY